jgi:hypothetical protein
MGDLHDCFKQTVRRSRGERLAQGQDAELFSGEGGPPALLVDSMDNNPGCFVLAEG